MNIQKQIGNNLKQARKAKNLNQNDIAKIMNMCQQAYSKYETGTIELDYNKIIFLCNLLDIEPNELFYIDKTKIKEQPIIKTTTINNSFNGNNNNVNI